MWGGDLSVNLGVEYVSQGGRSLKARREGNAERGRAVLHAEQGRVAPSGFMLICTTAQPQNLRRAGPSSATRESLLWGVVVLLF